MVILITIFTIALCVTTTQPQTIYAEPSSQIDPALKERITKQYSLSTEPIETYSSHSNYGVSLSEGDSFSNLCTALLRIYFRLL